ncbi:MAG TPA: redoxin domain-containing protein, partial [Tepidisphaeraceae bacterium]|nr:redoxin domain-containing protein [Tepidisphaeraceae bacterium]
YTLNAYGSELRGRYIDIAVPSGQSDFEVPPIELTASGLAMLIGEPAPELEGVEAWRGGAVKLADLKGKYVLLDFWGYWCGPCVAEMPVLMKLDEKFKDKGLAVIGVHVDSDGEVDTVAKLDERLVEIKEKSWNGRDVEFPVALTSGKPLNLKNGEWQRGGVAAQYGILGYPTTVLIDREGKVVGKFSVGDEKSTVEEVEKLLAEKK